MRRIILIFVLQLSLLLVKAQDSSYLCGVPDMDTTEFTQLPWFDNNQLLEDFLDSIGYPSPGSRIMDGATKYRIPVKFWIYRDDNGIGGPTQIQIQKMMDNLNRLYNQVNDTRIGFYMKCEPTYINNSANLHKTTTGALILFGAHSENGSINVHVVNSLSGNNVGFSVPGTNSVIIERRSYNGPVPTTTLAHEVGHIFGLLHTHQYSALNSKCLTECVSRTRNWPFFSFCFANRFKKVCESTGDALKDTPADPNLINNNACTYILGGADPWGDPYPNTGSEMPDPKNIMSYNADDNCVDHFSRLQIAVMLRTIKWTKLDASHWDNNSYIYDSYEPDNSSQMARTINMGESQEHNFNRQFEYNGWGPTSSQCDIDWVRFTAPISASISFITSDIYSRINADTRLTLFSNNLTQLAQNDNISSTNLFSSISYNVIAGQTYFIRVENMAPGTTSYYRLSVNCSGLIDPNFQISGNGTICSSETFSILNLPVGTTIQWQVSDPSIGSIDCSTCNQVTLTKVSNGPVTLSANVTICSQTITLYKTVIVGTPTTTCYEIGLELSCSKYIDLCLSEMDSWQTIAIPGSWGQTGDRFHLQVFGGGYFSNGLTEEDINGNYIDVFVPNNGENISVFVWAANSCGPSYITPWGITFSPNYGCYSYYMVSPNPAQSNVTVSVNKTKTDAAYSTFDHVSVYDQQGNLKLVKKFGKVKTGSINVSNLINGIYIIEIGNGRYKEKQKLVVQK